MLKLKKNHFFLFYERLKKQQTHQWVRLHTLAVYRRLTGFRAKCIKQKKNAFVIRGWPLLFSAAVL